MGSSLVNFCDQSDIGVYVAFTRNSGDLLFKMIRFINIDKEVSLTYQPRLLGL